jgi:hypothetical protein
MPSLQPAGRTLLLGLLGLGLLLSCVDAKFGRAVAAEVTRLAARKANISGRIALRTVADGQSLAFALVGTVRSKMALFSTDEAGKLLLTLLGLIADRVRSVSVGALSGQVAWFSATIADNSSRIGRSLSRLPALTLRFLLRSILRRISRLVLLRTVVRGVTLLPTSVTGIGSVIAYISVRANRVILLVSLRT